MDHNAVLKKSEKKRSLKILQDHKSLQDIIVLFDIDEPSEKDELTVVRVCNVKRFLSKSLFVAEMFTGIPGRFVDLETTIPDIDEVLSGKCDDTPEIAFDMVGDWMDANTHRYLCFNIWKVLMMVWCGLTKRSRMSEKASVRS